MLDLILSELPTTEGFSKNLIIKISKPINFSTELVIIEGSNHNRDVLSSRAVDILLSPEKVSEKDQFNQRNSGLNHVLCLLARKNEIAIGFNIQELIRSKGKNRAQFFGRMQQNIRLCRKYKVRMVLASFASSVVEQRSVFELQQFGIVLGMPSKEAKEALQCAELLLNDKPGKIKPGLLMINNT